jgi:hypothetical protein
LGLDHDVRKDIYDGVDKITLTDIKKFHNDNLKDKKWNIKLIGSKKKLDMETLKKYGNIKELTIKDIFGYEVEKTEEAKP